MTAPRVVLLGASFVERGSPFASHLATAIGRAVDARGIRGATVTRWASAVDASVSGHDVVIVEMGGNGAPTVAEVEAADDAIRRHGPRSIRWVLPPVWPVPGTVRERRALTRSSIAAARVESIDAGWLPEARALARDGQHLTAAAYADFARAVAGTMTRTPPGAGALAVVVLAIVAAWRWFA